MSKYIILFACLNCAFVFSWGQDCDNWRGPNYNGSSNTKESLPTKFNSTTNIKWKYDLPGPSAGTPIVNDQLVFVSSIKINDEKSGKGDLLALCLNRDSGRLIWENYAG